MPGAANVQEVRFTENRSSATAPALLYHLHPCRRAFSAYPPSLAVCRERGDDVHGSTINPATQYRADSKTLGSLLPQEGVVKAFSFSLREKARMRGSNKINRSIAIDHLTLTLSCKERVLLRHPPQGEGQDEEI